MRTNPSVLKRFLAFLILLSIGMTYAQNSKKEMYGVVKDQYGEPLLGVSILLKDNTLTKVKGGVTTDLEGKYRISSKDGKGIVIFSFVGMKMKKVPFKKGEFNLVLKEEAESLDEVVISTGYQNVKINEMAGSVNRVDMKGFENRTLGGKNNIITTLEALSPSIVAASNPSDNGSKNLLIRGVSTLSGNSSPLIILDGFPYQDGLETINPYDIANITILKDAASASIYGAKSANGVIVITTKRGKSGQVKFTYNSSVEISDKKDIEYYLNRASSSSTVGVEKQYDVKWIDSYENQWWWMYKEPYNKTIYYRVEQRDGKITDKQLAQELAKLETTDNLNDYKRLFLQSPLYTEHNISADYAKENIKLRSSLNYFQNKGGFKGEKNKGIRYTANTLIDLTDRVHLDLLTNFNYNTSEANKFDIDGFMWRTSPYERLFDDNGKALSVTPSPQVGGKHFVEIENLKKHGLLDETFYPATDFDLSKDRFKKWGAKFQAQMRLDLFDNLEGNIGFNISKSNATRRLLYDGNSSEMKTLINNTTLKTEDKQKGELLIPIGDRLQETKTDFTNYMLRGQLNYNKTFDDIHKVQALVGSEIQAVHQIATVTDRFGYNQKSGLFFPINEKIFQDKIKKSKVFAPRSLWANYPNIRNRFIETENRYFSLYGNVNYSFDNKYILHGSIRIDQSNLFGTDPKYRFKPLWSFGGKWRLGEEDFFKNDWITQLDLQASYGINGNISNTSGPVDIARYSIRQVLNNPTRILSINRPRTEDLRWEKTNTLNLGIATSFKNRVKLAFDYYIKNTNDVFALTRIDPTMGFTNVPKNQASIVNNGYEVTLETKNIVTDDFQWSTYLGVNWNKSKVKDVYTFEDPKYSNEFEDLLRQGVRYKSGYAPNSLFLLKYKGVDKEGYGQIEKSNKELVSVKSFYDGFRPFQNFNAEDIMYAGTVVPNLVARMTNNLKYKNLELSLMFVYQGGHVLMKDSYNGEQSGTSPQILNADISKAWKKPKDEEKEGVVPKLNSASYNDYVLQYSTKNIISGDFIRLRDVMLSYSLPVEKLYHNKIIKNITFNLKAKNLYLWTKNKEGIDPEVQGMFRRYYPIPKSFSLGVNVTF